MCSRAVVVEVFLEVFEVIVVVLLVRRACVLRLKPQFALKHTEFLCQPSVILFQSFEPGSLTLEPGSLDDILLQRAMFELVHLFVVVANLFVPLLFVRHLLVVRLEWGKGRVRVRFSWIRVGNLKAGLVVHVEFAKRRGSKKGYM